MVICVIDMHPKRREALEKLLLDHGEKVLPSESGVDIDPTGIDLILLHAGTDQDDCGATVKSLIDKFNESLIICYTGGTPVESATEERKNLALYRADVPRDSLGEMFRRTVLKVLEEWPRRHEFPQDWFKSIVTGFDAVLEAKLEILSATLEGKPYPSECKKTLKRAFPQAFDERGDLIVGSGLKGIADLRKLLFNEDSWKSEA